MGVTSKARPQEGDGAAPEGEGEGGELKGVKSLKAQPGDMKFRKMCCRHVSRRKLK